MPSPRIRPLDHPELPPLPISARLRSQLIYFAATAAPGAEALGDDEYRFPAEAVAESLESGVVALISPLDTANMTEIELSEEQETFLQWLADHHVEHVRVE